MKRRWWIYLSFILCCGLGACSKDANPGTEMNKKQGIRPAIWISVE